MNFERMKTEDYSILKQLYQYYRYEVSPYSVTLNIKEDGFYPDDDLKHYLDERHLLPLIIREGNRPVGFVLMNTPPHTPEGYDYFISDVFIIKAYRHQGLMQGVLENIFIDMPGTYAVLIATLNEPAVDYFHRLLPMFLMPHEETEMVIDEEKCIFMGFDTSRQIK